MTVLWAVSVAMTSILSVAFVVHMLRIMVAAVSDDSSNNFKRNPNDRYKISLRNPNREQVEVAYLVPRSIVKDIANAFDRIGIERPLGVTEID